MRKLLSYFFIILGLAVMAASGSRYAMSVISDKRGADVNRTWWGEHCSYCGDLVNMAFLENIKKYCYPLNYQLVKAKDNGVKNIDLYMWGDSYVEFLKDSVFANVDKFSFGRIFFGDLKYKLDSSKRNVLILESTERSIRAYYSGTSVMNSVRKADGQEQTVANQPRFTIGRDDIFNPRINQNLEYNLFNYNFLNPIRQAKAGFTYDVFDRASGDVVVSEDRNFLFLKECVVPNGPASYREPISDAEMNQLLSNLNAIYAHYKTEGFAEIYLAIIPNPSTMLQPQYYNDLLPRLQNNSSLQMPVIDLYTAFKKEADPASLYRIGDTHWNNKGLQLWLDLVNERLAAESRKKAETP